MPLIEPQNQYIFFLGSTPALSAAEALVRLRGAGYSPAILKMKREYLAVETRLAIRVVFLKQLGGTDRIARIIARSRTLMEPAAATLLLPPLPEEKKLNIGISVMGLAAAEGKKWALDLKQQLKQKKRKVRMVLPKSGERRLNAAQVIFNGLTNAPNHELTLIREKDECVTAETLAVQDIQAYEARDTARPARDAVIGMLPPKLAQMMINLAAGEAQPALKIIDPFCGLGTVLQEGWLLGHAMSGSDNNPDMLEASSRNLRWMARLYGLNEEALPELLLQDARKGFPRKWADIFDAAATETYLGDPLRSPLSPKEAERKLARYSSLYIAAFGNMKEIIKSGARVVFAFPAFRKERGGTTFITVGEKVLDAISGLGYSKQHLVPEELRKVYGETPRATVIYARPDALVGREITLWQKV